MIARYIRVSTTSQNTERQEVRGKRGEAIYMDKVSGAIPFEQRPKAKLLINEIGKGSITNLYVSSLDRMGRNTEDILRTLTFCNEHNVVLHVENIGLSNKLNGRDNPVFKLIVSVLAAISEVERENLLERQREGILLAQKRGAYKGRVSGTTESADAFLEKHQDILKELKKNKLSIREVAKMTGKSKSTVMKVKKLRLL